MNELVLRVQQNPGTIDLNFDELNKQLDIKLSEYEGAVFTEESKDIAKAELAGLRKLKKEIEDTRKAAKNKWLAPFESFEAQMKGLSKKVDSPIALIDEQVKDFDSKQRRIKKEKCVEIFKGLVGDMSDYLTFDKIFNPKWELKATSIKSITEEIQKYIDDARITIESIKAMDSEKEQEAIKVYMDTMSMAQAIDLINRYERQKAEILAREEEKKRLEEERRIQAEIDRARAAERENALREQKMKEELEAKSKPPMPEVPASIREDDGEDMLPFEQPTTITAFYKVVATPEELEQVEMAFNSIGIYFERREA